MVVRSNVEASHPRLNTWLPRGQLGSDAAGNLILLPNLQHTFQGLAQATEMVETRSDGNTAQVYRLVSVELQTPPRAPRPRPGH